MAIIKCKMCGGDLNLTEGQTIAECEYCGSCQTVPNRDNEKKLSLFARANRLRLGCEFDKAAGIYESIVAEFPEEPEAYWGLVLCKYGIEYVDDPATGRKIPTCHRSGFDSVMEDGDFEQALENSDAVARRLYREEAKQIEELRKGIIAVSSNEQPYDIFICYKETDEKGERTLDSVLAQDIYEALTDRGYRVFFSRITLEDTLGVEFEPYIFAALNSAKIMLAVGTDYEYFNAVWVKNEWGRYLKLMATDKSKHLIPCFKGIDAYDMPREFAKLQAQDLGKVGAMQDLLRGIEKILPRVSSSFQVPERVVVGTTAGNKIASLLDRGNMALEDGDWSKADSFFEDALNNDSKNAQGYLGKTLAAEKCRTLDAFIRKRQEACRTVRGRKQTLAPDRAQVQAMAEQYTVPGYLEEKQIRELCEMDLSYHSSVAERQEQYRSEEQFWASHKSLARAEKFASGEFAATLAAEKKRLFEALAQRTRQAEAEEAEAVEKVKQRYQAHLNQADEKAKSLYEDACRRREADYENLLNNAKNAQDPKTLDSCAAALERLGSFRDSKHLAEHCRKRAEEIREEIRSREIAEKARRAEEEERRIIAQRKADREAEARKKRRILISSVAAVVCFAVFMLMVNVVIPTRKYRAAEALAEEGKNLEAAKAFFELVGYDRCPDALQRSMALWDGIAERSGFDSCFYQVVVLNSDGTVSAKGVDEGQLDVEDWTDIISVSAGTHHTVGLRSDGTVVSTKPKNAGDRAGQNNVTGWTGIVAISAGAGHTVGLKADGTVVSTTIISNPKYGMGQDKVSGWSDIVDIVAGAYHTVGLKADGTVVAVGLNSDGQCDVLAWNDIVDIAAGVQHTVGLRSDGTVIAVGANGFGQCNVEEWMDIVSIAADSHHTLGLKADGTVVAVGYNNQGQCEVSEWRNIVALAAGTDHTVGLTAEGKLLAVGEARYGMCELEEFADVRMPAVDPRQQTAMAGLTAREEARRSEIYTNAEALAAEGKFREAADVFQSLGDYRDSPERVMACRYQNAQALAAAGKDPQAAIAYGKLGDYLDAREKSLEVWNRCAVRQTIAGGYEHSLGVKADGTVYAMGRNSSSQCNLSHWEDIIAVCAGHNHSVGLRADGTVVAVGHKGKGQCNVDEWCGIVSIAAGGSHTVGLKMDGTVVAAGNNAYGQCEVGEWTDIVAIAAGELHTLGLKTDGTVVAVGQNAQGQCEVGEWTDIVAVSAGAFHAVGLRADGTVAVTKYLGKNQYYYGQCEVSDWTDIVAIAAGWYHTVGLKADGTVVANVYQGNNSLDYGQCSLSGWKNNMAAIAAGGRHTIGLKADGTVWTSGLNTQEQCELSGWKEIKLPGTESGQ